MKKIRLISVLPISWFVLNEKFQQNASKFAIGNPCIDLSKQKANKSHWFNNFIYNPDVDTSTWLKLVLSIGINSWI